MRRPSSTGSSPAPSTSSGTADNPQRHSGHHRHGLAHAAGALRVGGIAVEGTLVDALEDRREAKEAEGEIERPVAGHLGPGPPAIELDIFGFCGNAMGLPVDAAQA